MFGCLCLVAWISTVSTSATQPDYNILASRLSDAAKLIVPYAGVPGLLFIFVFMGHVSDEVLVLWICAMLFIEVLILAMTHTLTQFLREKQARLWYQTFFSLHVVVCFGWGLAGTGLMQDMPDTQRNIATILAICVACCSTSLWSWRTTFCSTGNAAILLPVIVWYSLTAETAGHVVFAAAALVNLVALHVLCKRETVERVQMAEQAQASEKLAAELGATQNELLLTQQALEKSFAVDLLTGLSSLDVWQQAVESDFEHEASGLLIANVDMRNFTQVNQRWGKSVGDQTIRKIAQRLLTQVPERHLTRLSAEEFMLAKIVANANEAETFARQLDSSLRLNYQIGPHSVHLVPSIGICQNYGETLQLTSMLQRAQIANHKNKLSGEPFSWFKLDMADDIQRFISIEQNLVHAIDQGELEVHFQPKVCLSDRRIHGAEAWLRWTNTELGSVSPAEFIPVAEQNGQIQRIGRWVLEQSCRMLQHWEGELPEDFHIAVNVSSKQLQQGNLVEEVASLFETFPRARHRIHLEITETALIEQMDDAIGQLHELRKLGTKIALDDFGTGFSSMYYLKSLELDYLKIDRSLVSSLSAAGKDLSITRAIVKLAEDLSIGVIAEGIENEGDFETLKGMNCAFGQGWLFGKPVSESLFKQQRQADTAFA